MKNFFLFFSGKVARQPGGAARGARGLGDLSPCLLVLGSSCRRDLPRDVA